MCSIVSTDSTRSNGVEVFVVDRRGNGRFKPQSPLESEDGGVVMVKWVGYGRVAVSELNVAVEDRSPIGRGRGGGIENNREALKRAPPGDTLRVAMAVDCQMGEVRRSANLICLPKGLRNKALGTQLGRTVFSSRPKGVRQVITSSPPSCRPMLMWKINVYFSFETRLNNFRASSVVSND